MFCSRSLEKKIGSKLELAAGRIVILTIVLGAAGAVTGALAGLALSYVNLPPLIAGGIIGSAIDLLQNKNGVFFKG